MEKLRYNRAFKKGMTAIVICILLFGSVLAFALVAKIQYDGMVAKMKTVEATVVDFDVDMHIKGPDEQMIYIAYEVGGVAYSRELDTDTSISFSPGVGAHYSVGDKIEIYYDPQDPEVIASPRSEGVGSFYTLVGVVGLALMIAVLICMLKNSRQYLVTQAEYEQEKEALKKEKKAKKKRKR